MGVGVREIGKGSIGVSVGVGEMGKGNMGVGEGEMGIRLSMSALMGDLDLYPWVFFCLLLQPGSLKDLLYGLPYPWIHYP